MREGECKTKVKVPGVIQESNQLRSLKDPMQRHSVVHSCQ